MRGENPVSRRPQTCRQGWEIHVCISITPEHMWKMSTDNASPRLRGALGMGFSLRNDGEWNLLMEKAVRVMEVQKSHWMDQIPMGQN